MLKQFKNQNLDLNYFFLKEDTSKVLTSDGIIIDYALFNEMTIEQYNQYKTSCTEFYNYLSSKENESLIKEDKYKNTYSEEKHHEGKRELILTDKAKELLSEKNNEIDSTENIIDSENIEVEKIIKEVDSSNEIVKEIPTVEEVKEIKVKKPTTKKKSKKNKKSITNRILDGFVSWFELSSKFIMLIVLFGTGIMSIYYTGVHMSEQLGNKFIGFFMSCILYFFGIIGLNYVDIFKEQKKYFLSIVFLLTSLCTIGFSMCTALFVNGEKYYTNKVEYVQNKVDDSKTNEMLLENITEQIELKISAIEGLESQNETLSKTYSVIWDNEKKSNVVVEGKITEKAQDNINKNNELILQYRNEINELQNKKFKMLSEGIKISEESHEKIESFTDLVGKYLHFDTNYLQLFMILFVSVFGDLISPLSLIVLRNKNKKEENN